MTETSIYGFYDDGDALTGWWFGCQFLFSHILGF